MQLACVVFYRFQYITTFNNELIIIISNCIPTDITGVRYKPFGLRGLNNLQNCLSVI